MSQDDVNLANPFTHSMDFVSGAAISIGGRNCFSMIAEGCMPSKKIVVLDCRGLKGDDVPRGQMRNIHES